MSPDLLTMLTQFGVAGLMGALWVWERNLSRSREQQLNEAHDAITARDLDRAELLRVIEQNSRALERIDQTQLQLRELIKDLHEDHKTQRAA